MIRSIYGLKKSELQDLIDAVNMYAGDCIIITRTPDGLEISIDKQQLSRFIKEYYSKHR